MAENILKITIIWRDEEKEPLRATVESAIAEYGFLIVDVAADQLSPGQEHKTLMFPSDTIQSVELVEINVSKLPRQTDTNTFREEPGKSPHFRGMGQSHVSK